MKIYLGTCNHILTAKVQHEKANVIDPELICVHIVFEDHSGVGGDTITFRCPAESIVVLRNAIENIKEA